MNYEIENALRNKADKWELDALREPIDNLKSKNEQLENQVRDLQNRLNNINDTFTSLVQILIESNQFNESNQIYELTRYL